MFCVIPTENQMENMNNNINTSSAGGFDTTATATTSILTAVFKDRIAAEQAFNLAENRGYSRDDISVLMSDDTRKLHFTDTDHEETHLGNKSLEGAGAGAGIGGTVGAIIGAIAAIGTSIVLPGLGLVIAGPIAAALAGAGAGGLTGGLIGGLVGAGIPKERAELYESSLKEGGILLAIHPRTSEDARYLEQEWSRIGGHEIHCA